MWHGMLALTENGGPEAKVIMGFVHLQIFALLANYLIANLHYTYLLLCQAFLGVTLSDQFLSSLLQIQNCLALTMVKVPNFLTSHLFSDPV